MPRYDLTPTERAAYRDNGFVLVKVSPSLSDRNSNQVRRYGPDRDTDSCWSKDFLSAEELELWRRGVDQVSPSLLYLSQG
jgi:hypothetical protein